MTILVLIRKKDTQNAEGVDLDPGTAGVEIGTEIEIERRDLDQDRLVEDIVQDPEKRSRKKKKRKEIEKGRNGVYLL